MAISDELRKLVDPNNECCCEHCLSNMCKEWAYTKTYALTPMNDFGFDNNDVNNFKTYWTTCYINLQPVNGTHLHSELADTEPEAIFKATSYIMEQLKQKD